MALQNILDAIVGDADKRIADLTAAHKQFLKDLREQSDRNLERKQLQIAEQRDQKMRQMKEKTESHANMNKSKTLLMHKQVYMDRLYAEALEHLVKLPANKAEAFLGECMKHIHGKGVILSAASQEAVIKKLLPDGVTLGESIKAQGGFRFVSDTAEHDFTYEFLIHRLLRDATEVTVGNLLFPAKA